MSTFSIFHSTNTVNSNERTHGAQTYTYIHHFSPGPKISQLMRELLLFIRVEAAAQEFDARIYYIEQ